jgi:hypothetical protein
VKRVGLFAFLTIAGGIGGLVGSIIGAAFGEQRALFIGGFLGGPVMCAVAAWLAGRLRWIPAAEVKGTAIGAAVGFLAAATIAVNTLGSPVGPVLSTLCVGIGGLVGASIGGRSGSSDRTR